MKSKASKSPAQGRRNEERAHTAPSVGASREAASSSTYLSAVLQASGDGAILRLENESEQWTDLIERRQSGERLASANPESDRLLRLYHAVLSTTPDLAYIFDLNHRVTYANEAMLAVWGRTLEEAIGKNLLELGYPDWEAARHEGEMEQTAAAKKPVRGEVEFTGAGGPRIYDYFFTPVIGPDGEVEAIAGTSHDITDRKAMEEALIRTEKLAAAGRLAATVAHEINNPLESLTNLVYLAQQDETMNAASRRYLNMAAQVLSRASQVAKQTLGFYRETAGPSWLDVSAQLSDLIGIYRYKLDPRQVSVEGTCEAKILASLGEFRQIFSNLLVNAADATSPEKGRIRVRVRAAGNGPSAARGVWITVADNGCGIPDADKSRIFEPFYTTKRDVGTGLGLWLSRELVRKHGASLRVRSRVRPGDSGTVFSVFWPSTNPR